jgi:hypothetical protein
MVLTQDFSTMSTVIAFLISAGLLFYTTTQLQACLLIKKSKYSVKATAIIFLLARAFYAITIDIGA